MKKKRDVNADLIRVIACLCVLGIHNNDLSGTRWTRIFWHILFADGVGIFFLLAGFFMFRKPVLQTIKNVFLKVYVPGLITLFLIFWFGPWLQGENGFIQTLLHPSIRWKDLFWSVWVKGTLDPGQMGSHLWYIYTYMDLALTMPLIKPICLRNIPADYRRYILLLFLGCRVVYDITFFHTFQYAPALYMQIPTCWILAITGWEIYSNIDKIKGNRLIRRVSGGSYLLVQAARLLLVRRIVAGNPSFDRFYYYDCVPGILTAISLVLFILSFQEEQLGFFGKLAGIGPYTFLVYLIHNPLIRFMSSRGYWTLVKRIFHIPGIGESEMSFAQEFIYLFISIAGVLIFSLLISIPLQWMISKCKNILRGREPAGLINK